MNLYKLAFNNIRRRKLRSALTMMGIIIGVATVVVLLGATAGATSALKDETNEFMYDVLITTSTGSESYLLDAETVSKIYNQSMLYGFREETIFADEINGTRVNYQGITDWKQVELKNGTTGVVINQAVADKFGYSVGDKIKIKNQDFAITGISKEEQALYVYLSQDTAKKIMDNKVTVIYARTNKEPKTAAEEIEKTVNGVSAETKSDRVQEVQEMTDKALLFIGMIASIALFVGIISVINTMMISVMERTRELGVLKAIGFTNWEIKGSILFESGLLGVLGAIMGLILGIIGILVIANILELTEYLPGMMPLWLILGVIAGATLLSILAGLYPAIRASKLNVVEALRNE